MKSLLLLLSLLLSTSCLGLQNASGDEIPPLTIGQKKAKAAGHLQISLVSVTDANNPPDSNGYGSVANDFRIGKYDVTAREYCQFLNAVASKSDLYALYNDAMSSNPNIASITRTKEADGSFTYTLKQDTLNLPIAMVSWFSAARFCNWMHHGQPIGEEGPMTTETGSYALNGAMKDENGTAKLPKSDYCRLDNEAKFFLPTEDQWYKAAYYKRNGKADYWDYPTASDGIFGNEPRKDLLNQANCFISSNSDKSNDWLFHWNYKYSNGGKAPFLTSVGDFSSSPGPYGTFDMGGNLFQWVSHPGYTGTRVIRGGCWKKESDELKKTTCITANPAIGYDFVGFRIAAPAE
jgi:formylglycine-generating enzyme required for sulfatase activity